MTVVADVRIDERIEMAESGEELTLDRMFQALEKMPVPEGTKVEIVEGNIFMSPQRLKHWRIIMRIMVQMLTKHPEERIACDVRIDYPGHLNAFSSDLTLLTEDAEIPDDGRLRYQDVACVFEVISRGTALNDYGPKKAGYAQAGVPVYVIVDPYQGRCHIYTAPKADDYATETKVAFGHPLDLTDTPVGLVLDTDEFPRD